MMGFFCMFVLPVIQLVKCDKMEFNKLLGKTITKIEKFDEEELIFTCSDGAKYRQYHSQDCCESVYIDDIVGDFKDLFNTPITLAEEAVNDENPKGVYDESFTWTFYKLATVKGYVDIKWYGSSNGYYSESVNFEQIEFPQE